MKPRRTAAVLTALCLSLAVGALGTQVACSGSSSSTKGVAPVISNLQLSKTTTFTTENTNSLQVVAGETAYLRASFAADGGTAVLTPGNVAVQPGIPVPLTNITQTTAYTLTVTSKDGKKATATATVTVVAAPSGLTYSNENATYYVGVQIPANTATVAGATPITYSVSPALPNGLNLSATTGAITGTPVATSSAATYTVTATNAVGHTSKAIQIAVAATPITFSVGSGTIPFGGSTTLSWDATSVAGLFSGVTITANPTDASLPSSFNLSGTANVSPAVTTTYTLSATPAAGGAPVTKTVDVTVGAAPVTFTSFAASPVAVPQGNSTTLAWSFTGIPTTLTLDGVNVLGSSTAIVTPTRRQTYTLFGENGLGSDTETTAAAACGVDLLAGKPGGPGSRDGNGTWASFNNPQSIAADADGNLYVADIKNNMFRKITPSGQVTTIAGSSAADDGSDNGTAGNPLTATFKGPRGIFPDGRGYIWLCDSGNALLRVITPAKDVKTVSGFGGSTTTNSPNQIVITSNDGTTAVGYIADYKAGLVKVSINLATMAATPTPIAGFNGPSGISADANGIVYVADTGNKLIKAVKNDTPTTLTVSGITLEKPYATAAITSGTTTYVLVADPGAATPVSANQVFRITVDNSGATPTATASLSLAGSTTLGAADGAGNVATFAGPQGIAVVGSTAYVADSLNKVLTIPASLPASGTTNFYNNTIRALSNVKDAASSADVTVTTFAGASRAAAVNKIPAAGTATLAEARFSNPQGVTVDKNGNAYLVDTGNNRLVRITPAGVVSNYPNDGASFSTPIMVAVDSNLNLYVLERTATNNTLKKVAADGTITTVATSAALGANCGGIAVTPDGSYLYVTDTTLVKRVALADGTVTPSTATFTKLVGITLDDTGTIYVVDESRIKSIADITAASATTVIGTTTSGFANGDTTTGKLNQPNGIAFVKDGTQGYLFVSDFYNSAIRIVTLGSSVALDTLVGTPKNAGTTAGLSGAIPGRIKEHATTGNPEGGFYRPQAIAVTPSGDLLVTTNETIMQLTAPLKK